MRLRGRASEDPLLKVGAAALALALVCAAAVAAYALLRERPAEASGRAVKAASSEPLVRSDPGVDPRKEPTVALRVAETSDPGPGPKPDPKPDPQPEPRPKPEREATDPVTEQPDPEPRPEPEPEPEPEPQPQTLPAAEKDWPLPTDEQVEATREPRRYDLPRGAPLGLTVRSIGLYDVPVLRSNTQGALDNGVIHARGTSMPWSDTPDRNVYLAGHRLGWPGTGSHLVFYRLNELGEGDEIVLKDRDGRRHVYRVSDSFAVRPDDVWVTGRIPGRDMLTLQTCTPIPGFEKRLIVRAERV